MISLHNIFSIAKYERKTLFRSWFFRIFSVLSLVVLFGMNFSMVIQGGGDEGWAIRAIPSAIPYFNLLILNVAQAIIAVFLASDFLKRDKKLDTTEVIYMRSMTNGEYVIGKTLGNLQVFVILNIAVIIMALIFNALTQGTSIDWASYGLYLLLISIPTLVFIMGLSFLLMSVIRNQAITFVLVLGYIGITLFLLQDKFYYIFDYMAFNIPMLSSDIVGFGNLSVILGHRGMYFGLGTGFIFLTIFLLKRLPQSEAMTWLSLLFSIVFIAGSGYLGFQHIHSFKQTEKLRTDIVALNNKYVSQPVPSVLHHNLNIEHQGEQIKAVSTMTVLNDKAKPLDQLIFSLNAGLTLNELKINGSQTPFLRDKHLIIVSNNQANIAPGDSAIVEFTYSGTIDESYCYLDIEEEERLAKYGKFVLNVDKRYAFITPEYVLLTQEANWYPKTGVTYSDKDVNWNHSQFIDFTLQVKTQPGLQAVSQGEIKEVSAGEFSIKNETPLTQLSLAIGHYKQKSLNQDSINFGVWYVDGHDYFSNQFKESKDTIGSIISEQFEDFKRIYDLEYHGKRINLVEVPAQFKTYSRMWTSTQEVVQPQQIFIQEKGYLLRDADFEKQKERSGRSRRGGNQGEVTELDKEIRVLSGFIRKFTEENDADRNFSRGEMTIEQIQNPYFVFPMLYNFQNNIQSDKWPITNRVFEAYLKGQATDMRSIFMSNMSGESEDVLANVALQDQTFEEILADPDQKDIADNVIKLKGDALFSLIQWKAGQEEFEEFLRKILNDNKYKNISFEEFDEQIYARFGIELVPIMDNWFKEKTLPGYLISPMNAVKVKSGDAMKTMVSLKITNFSNVEGLVKLSFRMGGGGPRGGGSSSDMIDKLIHLEGEQTKELSYLLEGSPRMVILNTLTSKNVPQTMIESFREVDEDPKAKPFDGEKVVDIPVQLKLPNEIVVDNEDPEFTVTANEETSLLEKLVVREEETPRKYQGINWWRPATSWTAVTNDEFYGEYVRSGYYIKGGEGGQVATWNVPVKKAGYYDVYFHLYKMRSRGRNRNQDKGNYNFTIYGDDGAEEAALDVQGAETGWNHLGSFYFSPDTAKIELSNKTQLRMVFADAVKLVEM